MSQTITYFIQLEGCEPNEFIALINLNIINPNY
jgi:hypothetical protein